MSMLPFFDNLHHLDDLFMPHHQLQGRHYYRPWGHHQLATPRADVGSKVVCDKDRFQVCLDVQQFAPDEITVKVVGQQIVVEGKHEEKRDEHGHVSRHFVRKYELPEGYHVDDVKSTLSSDGVLTIVAPKHRQLEQGVRMVPITHTGPAHKTIKETPKVGSDQNMQH